MVVAMMIAASVAGMTANVIRWTTGRARPNAKIESGWYGMWHDSKWVAGKYEFSAFPSAHTATMTGLATVWLFASRRWGALSVLPGIAMGWARIVNRAHHLSDVCVAMIVGIAAAYWTWRFLMPRVSGFLSNKVERKA
jgi:membrane-associated phospholipid phosphatase